METTITATAGHQRDVSVTIALNDDTVKDVARMFDQNGCENWDVIECVEVEINGQLHRVQQDEIITVRVRA